MKKIFPAALTVLFLIFSGFGAFVEETAAQQPSGGGDINGPASPLQKEPGGPAPAASKKVVDVTVENNKVVSTATILTKVKTQKGALFSQAVLNEDIKRLYALGYFEDIAIDVEERDDGLAVTFIVLEKPVVRSITFSGNSAIKENVIRKEISTKEDEMLSQTDLSHDLIAIRKLYESRGFQLTDADYSVELDEESNRADVTFVIEEKQRVRVKKVTFEGNKTVPANKLQRLMVTKPAWFFIQQGYFKSDEFESDLNNIRLYYQDMGYLDAKVDGDFEFSADQAEMYVKVMVDEGNRYFIGDIAVAGTAKFAVQDVAKALKIKPGDPFSEMKMRENQSAIQQFYYDRGYMDCEVLPDSFVDQATGKVNITYAVTEGGLIYVGMVRVEGNTKTKDIVIRRELRAYPGEPFEGARIRRSKERLLNLGYFEEVNFTTEPAGEPDTKDLVVRVKETRTGEFAFGGGYSSIDSLIGFVEISQKNFDFAKWPTFTGGGQDLRVRAEFGSIRQNYMVSWTDPWIMGYPYLFGFDFYRTSHERSTDGGYYYEEVRHGGDLRFGKEFTEYLSADATYKLEQVNISDIADGSSQSIRDEEGKNWLSRASMGLTWDRRNSVFTPTEGFYLRGTFENAGGFLGGDKDFIKSVGTGSAYFNFFEERLVLELAGSLGVVEKYADSESVPIYERFYAGGAGTIRGYKERAVSPRDASSNEPIGGSALFLANAECTFPLIENMIKGAVFFDTGEVWDDFSDVFSNVGDIKLGTGVGLRVKTPLGPIKLDYGFPLSDNRGDEKKGRFYFSMSHGF